MSAHILLMVGTACYFVMVGILACYGCYRATLLWRYYRVRSNRPLSPEAPLCWPRATIQIPLYNERYVAARAIRSACEVDYPRERLEIQLLDDSTDDTSAVIEQTIASYRRQGYAIHHLTRAHREGFKAGALAEGLRHAQGELLAVFDADFIIPRDFLKQVVPFFSDPQVGMVQARWGHVNADYSLLTQAQATLLDGHFGIEQVARHQAGRFFNFNGTAGVWRKATVEAAGGWSADTLTEDLDLSYRAQLAGWRGIFLADVVAPAELPVEINALKSQQYRWTKGSIQTAKKLLPRIFTSPLPWHVKREALCHLGAFFSYPFALAASIISLPSLVHASRLPHQWSLGSIWLVALGVGFYVCSQRELYPNGLRRALMAPWAVAVGMGLVLTNALAVLDGIWGGRNEFIRTPKFGLHAHEDRTRPRCYHATPTSTAWVELALAGYFLVGLLVAIHRSLWMAVPCLLLCVVGFGYVGWLSMCEQISLPHLLASWARVQEPDAQGLRV